MRRLGIGFIWMKVGIVNDSKAAAGVLRRILAELPGFELAWTAYSGEEVVQLCEVTRPDIVLMDLIMPGIDGAETTRRIMRETPCVILVVTATTVGNRDLVFEAMGYGALDAVNTPKLGPTGDMAGAGGTGVAAGASASCRPYEAADCGDWRVDGWAAGAGEGVVVSAGELSGSRVGGAACG